MLIIVQIYREQQYYLKTLAKIITIIINHKTLIKFINTKALARKRQIRQTKKLAIYNFKIYQYIDKKNLINRLSYYSNFKVKNNNNKKNNFLQKLIIVRVVLLLDLIKQNTKNII